MTRNPRADLLKAVAIFGVVFVHTPGGGGDLTGSFRFCVPVFVTLWSIFFEVAMARRDAAEHRSYVRSRLLRLAVPYLFWTGIYLLLYHRSSVDWRTTPIHTIIGGWFGGYGWPGQYFFIILFQLAVVTPWFRRLIVPGGMWATLCLGLIGYGFLECWAWRIPVICGVGDRLFVYWLPYVALGIGLARGSAPASRQAIMAVLSVGSLALAAHEVRWATDHLPKPSPYILSSVYVGSVALVLAAGEVVGAVGSQARPSTGTIRERLSGVFTSAIAFVGRHTFPIFVANPLIIFCIPKSISNSLGIGFLGELQHILLTISVIAACLLLGWVFRQSRLGILVAG